MNNEPIKDLIQHINNTQHPFWVHSRTVVLSQLGMPQPKHTDEDVLVTMLSLQCELSNTEQIIGRQLGKMLEETPCLK